ncbi:TetR/AcrR family transcriptional regulator [Methylocucumis oryzae]|uniref:HTH tetR-type domain-containing protein n=1 Tax=Methylocucumis oryzae TaxID=1632867 RepID=A0A0F3IKF1_9GAMM|nr:TetR/AcrR family transcriptional regulator [Methylocucumis oryzae]KJV07147.1 hypothetical protein VZ94_06645 [Methylocucumis oryzae]
MGITERRERERLNIRNKILDAARELFAVDGYDAVTMRRIADAIDYSPTTIYLYFKDKDALIRELCRIDGASLAEAFQKVAAEANPLQRLRAIAKIYVDFGIQHPNHYRLLFMTTRLNEAEYLPEMGHGNPETDGYELLLNTFNQAIAQQLLLPHLVDAHLLAQAFWASVHGIVAIHLTIYGDPWVEWRSSEAITELTIDTLLRGVTR